MCTCNPRVGEEEIDEPGRTLGVILAYWVSKNKSAGCLRNDVRDCPLTSTCMHVCARACTHTPQTERHKYAFMLAHTCREREKERGGRENYLFKCSLSPEGLVRACCVFDRHYYYWSYIVLLLPPVPGAQFREQTNIWHTR